MRRLCVVVILLLGLGGFAETLHAQTAGGNPSPSRERGFQLGQNYPNPFNPTTKIPFVLGPEMFESGRPVVVTVRIFNVLQQLVAIPVALSHPRGDVPVENLEYTSPGPWEAYWDGLDRSGRKVASGVYYMQLEVNGVTQVRKMIVAK